MWLSQCSFDWRLFVLVGAELVWVVGLGFGVLVGCLLVWCFWWVGLLLMWLLWVSRLEVSCGCCSIASLVAVWLALPASWLFRVWVVLSVCWFGAMCFVGVFIVVSWFCGFV